MTRVLLLLPLLLLACPEQKPDAPVPEKKQEQEQANPTLAPTADKPLPKFDLGQLNSDPELARRNKEALGNSADAGILFGTSCGKAEEAGCKK